MQQNIVRRAMYSPSVSARVAGREIGLTSYEIDRELPDPYSTSAGYTAASGSLTGLGGDEVTRSVPTPWDADSAWPPVGETAVEVSMDIGQGPVTSMAKGKVLGSDGDSSSREVNVEFSDRYQTLDQTISWNHVKASMPAHDVFGWDWTKMRYVGMLSSAVTDKIFRYCGWYVTPPMVGYTGLSIPAMGTMWPEAGENYTSGRAERGYPYWANTTWGVGVADFVGTYRVAGAYTVKERGRIEMTAMSDNQATYSRMNIEDSSSRGLYRLQWTSTQCQLYVRDTGGAYRQAATCPRYNGQLIYATVEYVTDTQVRCIIRCGDFNSGWQLFDCSNYATLNEVTDAGLIINDDSGAFQIGFPSNTGNLVGWKPNASINPRSGNRNHLLVRPAVEGENCLTLLKDQTEAEAGTFWIDEQGILQWWDLSRLEGRDPVETITSSTDITDKGWGWEHTEAAVKSRVSVKWKDPLSTWHPTYTITAWQGTGETLQAGGETSEYWVEPKDDDELWIMVDTAVQRVGTHDMLPFNQGVGTWYGGILPGRDEDEPDQWAYGSGDPGTGSMLFTLERITDRAFKASILWTGSREAVQKTPDFGVNSAMWRVRYNMDLPLVRCKGVIQFMDRITYSTQNGPDTAPEQVLDVGWWIQNEAQAQYTADYVGARVTIPQPVLSDIDVAPMPGLELGDVLEVYENRVLRATVRGILVRDSRKVSVSDTAMTFDQGLALRPTHIFANSVMWQEWASFIRPMAWQGWAAQQDGETWTQWGQNPTDQAGA